MSAQLWKRTEVSVRFIRLPGELVVKKDLGRGEGEDADATIVRFMRVLAPDREADVYAISCELGLTKIGVAADARERLRALQVGSPLPLELGWSQPFPRAEDAYAVAADVARQLAERRERGSWYRVTPFEVRHAIGNRSAAQAPREAAEARLRAPAAAAEAERQHSERARARRRGLTSTRRQKLRAAAELLVSGATQVEAGKELGVDQRTIRRWKKKRGFATELARARARQERAALRAQTRAQKRR